MYPPRSTHSRVLITTAPTNSFGALVFLGAIFVGCSGGWLLAKAAVALLM